MGNFLINVLTIDLVYESKPVELPPCWPLERLQVNSHYKMIVGQNYDNKAPVAETSLLNLSNWALWSVTPPHPSLSRSLYRSFYPPTISLLFLLFQPDVLLFRPSVIFGSSSLSSSHHLAPFICPSCCRFDWNSPLRSFLSYSVALGSFSVSLFHSRILLLFSLISCLCQNSWFLSSGSSSLMFPPFHPFFFFVLPYLLLFAGLSPPFSVLSVSDWRTLPQVFFCVFPHTSLLCVTHNQYIPVPYCTIICHLVDAYIL